MSDDLDDLKAMMTDATPAPDAARRAANLALAQKNFADLQGSPAAPRLTPVTGPKALWTGATKMLDRVTQFGTSKGGLTATTALVACGFMFLTPVGQDLWKPAPFGGLEAEMQPAPVVLKETDDQAAAPLPARDLSLGTPLDSLVDRTMERRQVLAAPPHEAPSHSSGISFDGEASLGYNSHSDRGAVQDDGTLLGSFTNEFATAPDPTSEVFANAPTNPLKITAEEPVSTFSIDVDTASYSFVRASLQRGTMPPADAVRVEELINYFPYDYAAPDGAHPFQPTVTVMGTPWNADTQLVHIGLQGEMPAIADRPALNLVFLIDTSGSMGDPTKLPLLKQSFMLMLDQLRPEDEVAIVEYAGSAGQVLPPTPASEKGMILTALARLGAGGSTNGQGGLEQAYATAEGMAKDGEIGRVILATDGDFNVGLNDPDGLETYIAKKRDTGTYLSVLGFGRGNLNDALMQTLAQNGNGQAAYIDTLAEAQKVLVDQLTGALFPIAGDVKVQVEFNPATVAEYRLIGYETRALAREDFNNDKVDAGELGAGHTVTAIYEVTPVGSPAQLADPLRYGTAAAPSDTDELGFLKLRYKAPGENVSQLIETPISQGNTANTEAQFAAAIAGWGQLLKSNTALGDWSYGDAIALANANRGTDDFGYRTQAVQLMRLSQSLAN